MIYQDIVTEIEKLPLEKQLSLMEMLARAISRRAVKSDMPKGSSLETLRGILKPPPGEPTPTDSDLSNGYTDYLLEKYA